MNHSDFLTANKSAWVLCDDDCLQFRRTDVEEKNQLFELVQINFIPSFGSKPDYYTISHGVIDSNDYTDEEINDMVLGYYGYPDITMVTNGEIAEMFFETEWVEYQEPEKYSSWAEAVAALEHITGLDLQEYKNEVTNNTNLAITNLTELYDTITKVVNCMVKEAAENTSSSNWIMGHDDVSHLISKEDYDLYKNLIVHEMSRREELLDIQVDNDGNIDVIVGLAYCPNYEPTREEEEQGLKYGYEKVTQLSTLTELLKNNKIQEVSIEKPKSLAETITRAQNKAQQQKEVSVQNFEREH